MLATPTQAHAAWGNQEGVLDVATVWDGFSTTEVGTVHGWVQFDSAGNDFRYSLDVCRQAAYTLHVTIGYNATQNPSTDAWSESVAGYITPTWGPSTAPCYGGEATVTGTVHAPNVANAHITVTGGTFVQGRTYVEGDDDYLLTNPY
jgi:hypothetical protein